MVAILDWLEDYDREERNNIKSLKQMKSVFKQDSQNSFENTFDVPMLIQLYSVIFKY